jgi:hypothetical protein
MNKNKKKERGKPVSPRKRKGLMAEGRKGKKKPFFSLPTPPLKENK